MSSTMEQVRSFIAIELPEGLRRELGTLQARLKSHNPPFVKWADPGGIHLTLKFLGNIATGKITEITRAIEAAAAGIPPFYLQVKGLGVFPGLKRVQVAWVGLNGQIDRLSQLYQGIEANLARLGFARESRPFTPHLTLARVRDRASAVEREAFGQIIASTSPDIDYAFEVDALSLMRSQLTREGAIYSPIHPITLRKPWKTAQY